VLQDLWFLGQVGNIVFEAVSVGRCWLERLKEIFSVGSHVGKNSVILLPEIDRKSAHVANAFLVLGRV
jgi:hypothetical protein